jgi:transmembrane sensor
MESSKETEKAAAEWLARRDSDRWTASDQTALDRWLNESTANTIAYIRLEAAWKRADRFKALGAGFPRASVPTPEEFNLSLVVSQADAHKKPEFADNTDTGTLKTNARNLRALAAGLLLAFVSATAWHFWPTGPDFETPVGGTASVPMTDGSRVTLNTDSAIRVAVTQNERQVELDHGEAYFEVAHDPNRPFIVNAGNKRVIAVGTRFSVQRADNNVRVVVTEGTVRLEEANTTHLRHKVATEGVRAAGREKEGSGELFLPAGSIASTDGDGILVRNKPLPEVEESLSWRNGYLIFHEITLAGAVGEFNRYNTRKIVIADPTVASITLSGKFRTTDCEAFVRLLEGGFPIRAQQADRQIILTSSTTM